VLGQGVSRALESSPRVAPLAPVTPWVSGELPLMFICMTIDALRKLDLEPGAVAGGNVARSALHRCMRECKREPRLGMVRDGEG